MTTDIFARPPRSARRRTPTPEVPTGLVGRVACAVCGLRANTLVCRECAERPDARGMVLGWLKANSAQANALLDVWDAVRAPNQASWDKIQAACIAPNFAQRCEAHQKAGNIYGQLLDAHAVYEAALQPLNIERARLEKALAVLETL